MLETRQSGFTDEQLLKMYICGLKDYIHSETKLGNPKTIKEARHAAMLIEQKDKFNKPSFVGSEASNKYSNEKPNKYSTEKSNSDKKWVKYKPIPTLYELDLRTTQRAKKFLLITIQRNINKASTLLHTYSYYSTHAIILRNYEFPMCRHLDFHGN